MRIIVCTLGAEPGPVGGAERQAWRQAAELARRGHSVTLVCPWTPGATSGARAGVRIQRLPQLPVRYVRTLTYAPFLFLYLITLGRSADIVHVHLANLQADVAAIASRLAGVPLYLKIAAGGPRGEIGRLAWMAPLTRRIGIRWASRVQAISGEIEHDLAGIGIPSARVVSIPNGLDTDAIRPPTPDDRLRLRVELGLPRDLPIVLFLGRFAGYKGIGDLLEAWPSVRSPAVLVLVGEPALDDPVPVPAATATLLVRGWTSGVAAYLRAADILVQPSHAEGMSNTLLEAMAAGLAIIATDVGAAGEMLGGGQGVLVPARQPLAIARELDALIASPARRAALGVVARAAVVEQYSIGHVVDRIEATYRQVLAEARR